MDMQLTEEQLLAAYKRMRDIREFEDRLHEENTNGDIPGFIHLYSGEEAVAVGICENLTDKDYITSTHRGHGHCIAKGCDIHAMMLEILGKMMVFAVVKAVRCILPIWTKGCSAQTELWAVALLWQLVQH
jgi:TPP-dependent pyruvate/acetoin dehydrogenase alpha subunit